jgi:two-component system sensor histidine kinase/response regulator
MADILVVDDDPGVLFTIGSSLKRSGHTVHTAERGLEALRKVEAVSPDLVILDVMMPEMTGWEVCQRIREKSDVPIVMLTAIRQEDAVVQGLDLGADEYLIKPVRIKELRARVEAVLRRTTRERQAAQEEVETLKRNIMGAVSHELRTPVAAILMALDLVLHKAFHDDAEQQRQFIANAQQNAEAVRHLIDDLLVVAQLDKGLDILRRPLSVAAELDRLQGRTRPTARARNISVVCHCSTELTVSADPSKFQHALRHLFDNALKFSPDGGEVTVVAESNADGSVAIAFSDQGPGIDPVLHERIFERFYQTNMDSGHEGNYDGLGIGLPIARAIARAHGGDVTVDNAPGRGSIFWLVLPGVPADWDC